jgi:hypothetical protein
MAIPSFTTQSTQTADIAFNGGLNSSSGPLSLQDSEASNLQNIDFNRFGSILKRNGYSALNTTALTSSPDIDGLFWFEFNSAGVLTRKAVAMAAAKFYKMDDLDGTWDDATNGQTITTGNHCDFESWRSKLFITNNADPVLEWDGAGTTSLTTMAVPTGLTDAKFVKQFNNYLFLANVLVSGTRFNSRIYYSNINNEATWTATDFIDVSNNDGQEITGLRVLGDRLVIYKNRSIYNLFFTGDGTVPFVLPNGGKSASSVGCASGYTIQDVDNGHIFLSYDGFYFYDGNNSYKISDKINRTFLGMQTTLLHEAVSMVQRNKNRYYCALISSGQTENDRVFVFDWYNNAWSVYTGWAPCSMATFYVSGWEERPYFGDYAGFVYRADTGTNDSPINVSTAINSIYSTNWRHYGDLVDKKGVPHVVLFYQNSNSVLDFSYSYDFEGDGGGLAEDDSNQYTQTIDLSTSTDVYGTGVYGTATYAGTGGASKRRDLTGRGRVIRFTFANNVLSETFQIDGIGTQAHLETNV